MNVFCIQSKRELNLSTIIVGNNIISLVQNRSIQSFSQNIFFYNHIINEYFSSVSKFCHYVQEGLPVNMKGIHVMNVTSFFDKVLLLLKPFLRKEVLKMVTVLENICFSVH